MVDVYLSGSQVSHRGPSGTVETLRFEHADWHAALIDIVRSQARRNWRIWLGGRLCRIACVEAVAGLKCIEEAEAAAAAVCSTPEQPVDARMAYWGSEHSPSWIVACMPVGLPQQCAGAIAEAAGRLLSLRPWWSGARVQWHTGGALCDDEAITSWSRPDRARITASTVVYAGTDNAQGALTSAVKRLRASGNMPVWRLAVATPGRAGTSFCAALEEAGERDAARTAF